jgi:hypothetical protein
VRVCQLECDRLLAEVERDFGIRLSDEEAARVFDLGVC